MAPRGGFTETGRKIVLGDDGAWEYADPATDAGVAHDFRKCHWGMSRAQVKNLEKTELLKEAPQGLVYSGRVSSFPCFIAYFFTQDRLVRARYNITSNHEYPEDYLEQFTELREILARKYGDPRSSEQKWWNEMYRDDTSSWGKAIALGHLAQWAVWETETSEISLMLRGADQEIFLEIEYCSKALADLEESEPPAGDLDEF
jgi:hypothetical protein